ncbi:ABC transporter ATP-binding protein [Pseudooceanicola sp.]|uniref:ABC transporter ATP-binding protein n=1 Tax=Pseudooceanicola sp. TaxID=1914328 RepID=UPI0035C6B7DF
MTILTLSRLTKSYGKATALNAVDLSLAAGERVALIGHNGAGKSTMMKLVLGLITPSDGAVDIAGHAPGSPVARALTAYLPENVAFHPALTGREQLTHYLRLRAAPVSQAKDLLARVGLADAADRRIGTWSKGMRQRLGLAQALIGTPRLMLLDEPTSGLDPVSRGEFYDLLDELSARGTAVILSSHALSEIEAKTDRVIVLSRGQKVAEGPVSVLRAQAALPLTLILYPRAGAASRLVEAFPQAKPSGAAFSVTFAPSEKIAMTARVADVADVLEDYELITAGLDEVYASISRRAA